MAGQVGGGDDGGIDGLYVFLDGRLLEEDADLFQEDFDLRAVGKGATLSLVAVQAKQSSSFAETPLQLLSDTLSAVLDLSKDEDELEETLSEELVSRARIFRQAWERLATRHPNIEVTVSYASKGDPDEMNSKVTARAKEMCAAIENASPKTKASVAFLGARQLVDLAAEEKSYTLSLAFEEMAGAADSHLLLVRLDDYLSFISEAGVLRKHIFDWNVRDYEGGVEVNKEIRGTLEDPDAPEFWWLNNGVTVLCSQLSFTNKVCSIDEVQVVNGLQTSVSIFNYLKDAPKDDPTRDRTILVRVIATQDPGTRDRVIRATNRQTAVQPASLRASDQIQRDLEQYFMSQDWFYERRKNYFRNQGKPAARIVTIPFLAQAVLACGFSDPSNSRARPSSLLKKDDVYARIFDHETPYSVYLWLAELQRAVDNRLRSAKLKAQVHTNLRFHTAMVVAGKKFGTRVYHPKQLTEIAGAELTDEEIRTAATAVLEALEKYLKSEKGQTIDRAVKSRAFTDFLLNEIFPDEGQNGSGADGK